MSEANDGIVVSDFNHISISIQQHTRRAEVDFEVVSGGWLD